MTAVQAVLIWALRLCALFVVLGAALPFIRSGMWIVRVWDFPRLQMLLLGCIALSAAIVLLFWARLRAEALIVCLVVGAAVAVHAARVVPYTALVSPTVPTVTDPEFTLVVANLDVRNRSRSEAVAALSDSTPEVLLLIEIDEEWATALDDVRDRYQYRVEVFRAEGLGMALWSTIPIEDHAIEHLVSDRRASIHAQLTTESGERVHLLCVHPTPPALAIRDGAGRYNSRIRDAELVRVAQLVSDAQSAGDADAWIVAGDFNDVAWSHTTRLFGRLSGLRDPRVGRGVISTYHADYPLLRYPLDHVFVSQDIGVGHIGRFNCRAPITSRSSRRSGLQAPRFAMPRRRRATISRTPKRWWKRESRMPPNAMNQTTIRRKRLSADAFRRMKRVLSPLHQRVTAPADSVSVVSETALRIGHQPVCKTEGVTNDHHDYQQHCHPALRSRACRRSPRGRPRSPR